MRAILGNLCFAVPLAVVLAGVTSATPSGQQAPGAAVAFLSPARLFAAEQQGQQNKPPAAGQNQQSPGSQSQNPPAAGQGQQPAAGQQPNATSTNAASTPAAPDPQEEAAYKAFLDISLAPQESDHQIKAGEQFLSKYPQSRHRETVYARLTQAYLNHGDFDKMLATAQEALQLNPDDYTVLVYVGWAIPHRVGAGDPNGQAQLDLAETNLKRALQLLPNISKPANISDADFQKAKASAIAQAHSGLGLVYYREGKVQQSVAELKQSTQIAPDEDPTDWYVMGIEDKQLKQFGDAAAAFDQCAKIPGELQQRCKQESGQAQKQAPAQPK